MSQSNDILSQSVEQTSTLATNKLIKNTYSLLSMTLIFSAMMAGLSMVLAMPPMTYLISLGAAFLMIWLVLPKTANSAKGIGVVFAITGLMGFALGPILNMYLSLPNGSSIIAMAMGGTGVIFLGLSAYAITTKKDFSFMGGFLMVGLLTVIVAAIANIFLQMPVLSIVISSAVIMLMSGFILFDTSRMVNHPHTANYVVMTVSLYLNIFNIFISLLQILGLTSND
ncbi:MAG: Bax inhibitor-1/YccA family protein [Pseudomonadota bacterium]